ncbi:MAG: hypothetical protein ACREVW_14240 [Burkholderiales bacterium]
MSRRTNSGIRIALMTAAALVVGLPPHAQAGDRVAEPLRGEYGFTTQQNCVRTPFLPPGVSGFDPSTLQLLVDGEVAEAVGSGVMHFRKNGSVTVAAGGTDVLENQISTGQMPVVPGTEYTCSGTYAVAPNKQQVTVTFPLCVVKTNSPGVTVTVGPLEFEGYVGTKRRAINLSMLNGNIQTVTIAVGGSVVEQRERICTQTLTLDKL